VIYTIISTIAIYMKKSDLGVAELGGLGLAPADTVSVRILSTNKSDFRKRHAVGNDFNVQLSGCAEVWARKYLMGV
jgi:hypothetical protein